MNIKRFFVGLAAAASLALGLPAQAQNDSAAAADNPIASLPWKDGPGQQPITDKASIELGAKQAALDAAGTKRFLELTGNLPADDHYTVIDTELNWFAVFSFDDIGYVKDDEKIDANDLLKTLKEADGPANEERQRRGLDAVYTDGWSTPPHYDSATRRLEWGLRLRDAQGNTNLNYTVRLLGRSGVINAVLVTDEASFEKDLASFRKTLEGFAFNSGQKYSEYQPGDKLAAVGLAALVLGGAAAVASKKGWWAALLAFLAKGWKLVAVAVVGVGYFLRKLFGGKSAPKDEAEDAPADGNNPGNGPGPRPPGA